MKKFFLLFLVFLGVVKFNFSAPPPAGPVYPFFDGFKTYNSNAGFITSKWYGGASSFRAYGSHGLFQSIAMAMAFESSVFAPKDSITSHEIGFLTPQSKQFFHNRLLESAAWPTVPYALEQDSLFRIKIIQGLTQSTTIYPLDSLTQVTPTTDFNYVEIPLDAYSGQTIFVEIYFDQGAQIGQHWVEIDDFGVGDVVVTGNSVKKVSPIWNAFYNETEFQVSDNEISQYKLLSTNGALNTQWNHQPGSEQKALPEIAKGIYFLQRSVNGNVEVKKGLVN